MPHLHLFNPGHEMEVLCGRSHYTPPYTIQKMATDLELLPVWYAETDSLTLVRNLKASYFTGSLLKNFPPLFSSPMVMGPMMKDLYRRKKFGTRPKLPPLKASPWGISPRSIDTFNELKQAGLHIIVPEWRDEYTKLTKRQTGVECLSLLQERFPITPAITIPEFFSDIEQLEQHVAKNSPPYIMKTPLSSSGRGLFRLNEKKLDNRAKAWINGALKRQEAVSIEPALDKVLDFAAAFYSDGDGNIEYVGLSIFETTSQGQFVGCMLGSQKQLLQRLNEFITTEDYMMLIEQVKLVLAEKVGSEYAGYMGVDMFIYKTKKGDYGIHPFVELNLRYTMGLVAMQLSRRFIDPASHGLFRITYYVYDTQKEHERMQEVSPLVIEGGKIRSGYMSLCPVNHDTNYMAVVDVFE